MQQATGAGGPLREQISLSLKKAETQRNRLKAADRRYSIANIVLGAIATFIAGESALAGEPMLGNWRLTTTVASVCTLGATVAAGVQRQVASPELLIETSESVARLKALRIETISNDFDAEAVSTVYQQILTEFSQIDL